MKCKKCGREIEHYIADAWNSCPGCHTRLMGFTDEMLPITIKILSEEVYMVLSKLRRLDERLDLFKQTETGHTDTQRLDFLLKYFSIIDVGYPVSAVCVNSDDLQDRLGDDMDRDADMRDVIDRAMGKGENEQLGRW